MKEYKKARSFLKKKKRHLYSFPKSCCSVTKLWPTFWDTMDCSMPGFPVHHYIPEFTQTHVHWVGDAIQPSHPVTPFSSCPQSFPASGSFPMKNYPGKTVEMCSGQRERQVQRSWIRKAFDKVRTVARVQEPGRNEPEMNWRCRQKPSPAEWN